MTLIQLYSQMTELNIDRQIQSLLQIKLGLEERSQAIFKELLNGKNYDPIDDMFKVMNRYKETNKDLKQQILKLQRQNNELKQRNGVFGSLSMSESGKSERVKDDRVKSLPQGHEQQMKLIQEKKKMQTAQKSKYMEKAEGFILFLIRCLKQISISKQKTNNDEALKLINLLQKDLNNYKNKVFQLQNGKKDQPQSSATESKIVSQSIFDRPSNSGLFGFNNSSSAFSKTSSSVSSQSTGLFAPSRPSIFNVPQPNEAPQAKNKPQENLGKLIKEIKNVENSEVVFGKICESLGLKEKWDQFIQDVQISRDIANFTRQLFLPKANNINVQTIKKSFQQSNKKTMLEIQKIEQQTSKKSFQHFVESVINTSIKKSQQSDSKYSSYICQCMRYFYNKLDTLLSRHNQHPFHLTRRPEFTVFQDSIKSLVKYRQWEQILQQTKSDIDSAFYYIERRTKFYSTNRAVVVNRK